MVSPFIFPCLPFSLTGVEVTMNCTAFTYYFTLMAKRMCVRMHHLFKLLATKRIAVVYRPIQVSQDSFMLRLIYIFLGCDMLVPLVLSSK